jgi:hypothetical protein
MATMSTSISGVSQAGRIAASTYLRELAATELGDFDHVLMPISLANRPPVRGSAVLVAEGLDARQGMVTVARGIGDRLAPPRRY